MKNFYQTYHNNNLELTPPDLEDPIEQRPEKPKTHWFRKVLLILGIIIVVGGILFSYRIFSASKKIFLGKDENSILNQIKRLILSEEEILNQEERIDILLIGIRGVGHNKDQGGGPFLADTIMILSLKPQTKEVAMLSIPRDLWIETANYGQMKINATYAYGLRENSREGGSRLLSQTVEKIAGIPIDYYLLVDFTGFEQAIDTIGGIDLVVDQPFTDYLYPTWDYEYQTISFQAGPQHMDGDKALKFVRSRHGTNGEGSDFARSRRQQKVLAATKDKIFSIGTILNPLKLAKLIDSMGNHLITNLDLGKAKELIQLSKQIELDKIKNRVLDDSPDGLLVASRSNAGASILVPRAGNFEEIQSLAQNIFNSENQNQATKAVGKEPDDDKVKIQVRNGTDIVGLADKVALELEAEGYQIVGVLNADSHDYEKTVIFDHTEGSKEEALKDLKTELDANVSAGKNFFLDQSEAGPGDEADFVIVLGYDQEL